MMPFLPAFQASSAAAPPAFSSSIRVIGEGARLLLHIPGYPAWGRKQ